MGYYADQLPRLNSYGAAKDWYDTREPYKRGRRKGLRPLGGNRRCDRSLISLDTNSEGQNVVVCSYHTTPVITFCEDGSLVLNHDGHETVSTMDFINCILRSRFNQNAVDLSANNLDAVKWTGITRRRGKLYFSDGCGKDHRFESVLKFTPSSEIIGAATEKAWVLDKERMAKVRKHYAEFTEYLTYYAQMQGEKSSKDIRDAVDVLATSVTELRWQAGRLQHTRDNFFGLLHQAMQLEGEDKFAAFLPLANQVVINASQKQYDFSIQSYRYTVTPARARDHFYELCRFYYAVKLFRREQVPQGKIVLDENAKYVNYSSDAALPFAV